MSGSFDVEEFLAGFLAEAEEHLRAANANLLTLDAAIGRGEATPRQVRELFRALHTIKGLSAMVGVEPIVEIAHAMESVLRDADRAGGRLPPESVQPLLNGVKAIEQRVAAVARKRSVAAPPQRLIEALAALKPAAAAPGVAAGQLSLDGELLAKLSATEREQLAQGIAAGRRALRVDFIPRPAQAAEGVNITLVRERLASVAEIVKVIPRSVPASEAAPGGLAFVLIVLANGTDEEIARAAATTVEALVPISAVAAPEAMAALDREEEGADDEPQRRGFIRVDVRRLDDALEKLSALVVTRFRLSRAVADLAGTGVDVRALSQVVTENGRHLRDLRASIMRARMVPVAEVLERVPLLVRGLARSTGKRVRVEIEAGKAELDKAVAERIFPAIVHLVRNAVDHGLEGAEERSSAGKSEEGLVRVACFERSGNQLELTVSDDGRGIDRDAVARQGGQTAANDKELLALMARPGLSTRGVATTTSGRGVGMEVVRRVVVDELGGDLALASEAGRGTTFTVRIPLSITIVDAFSFLCGGETFVVPVAMVEEIQEVDFARVVHGPDRRNATRGPDRRAQPRGTTMLERRGEAVPLIALDELFGLVPALETRRKAIVIRRNGQPFAFVVDRMIGQQEVVVRPLEDPLVRTDGVTGSTDLGDGRPTLVLDLAALGDKLTFALGATP